jgi:hypothetical protein
LAGAEVLVAGHALPTVHAARGGPADSDLLADLHSLGRRAYRRYAADDLVAEHGRVLRDAPVVVQHRNIRVAKTAVFDRDVHLFGAERTEVDVLEDLFLLKTTRKAGRD